MQTGPPIRRSTSIVATQPPGKDVVCFVLRRQNLQKLKVTSKQLISEWRNRTVNTWYFTIFYSLFFHAHFLQIAYRH